MDTSLELPYDVLLTKVDLECKPIGLYHFYKIQIIEQKSANSVLLFTRWGNVGELDQYHKTSYATVEAAVVEFKKVFKAKTGNQWEAVKEFAAQPKKYRIVDHKKRRHQKQRHYKMDAVNKAVTTGAVEPKLPEPLHSIMKTLIGIHSSDESYRSLSDESFTPFGLLSDETLLTAESLLTQIETLIDERNGIKGNQSQDYFRLTNDIIDRSEQFYHLLPLFGGQYERLSPLFTREALRDKQELIHNLVHFEYAFELLLAAQYRLRDVNPSDYIYKSLGCHLQLLDRNEEECQLILQYIHNTTHYGKAIVKSVYRVNRNGEEKAFDGTGVDNRWLLWHGTRAANVLSILAKGLQKSPLSAQMSGHLFGKVLQIVSIC